MIQQVQSSFQFHGLPGDDANKHLDKFLTITQSMKQNRVTDDAFCLLLFPCSLIHHATAWFDRLPKNSFHSFEQMERYKLSIDRCPNHNQLPVTQIDTFYNGVTLRHRDTINAAAGGTFMKKRPKECYDLIENMTARYNDWDNLAHRAMRLMVVHPNISSVKPSVDTLRTYILPWGTTMQVVILTNPKERPQGVLPSNTIPNPREEIKEITTLSGIVLDGPLVPPPPLFSSSKEVEQDPKTIRDHVLIESTIRVLPSFVESPHALRSSEIPLYPASSELPPPISSSFELPKRNPHQPPIHYPSRLNKEKI
nr:reverse transcriptase domain-containing protein [Tanacetum cinerariifolium]